MKKLIMVMAAVVIIKISGVPEPTEIDPSSEPQEEVIDRDAGITKKDVQDWEGNKDRQWDDIIEMPPQPGKDKKDGR